MQVGDVVQLKSGGPYMTVSKMCDDGNVECVSFLKFPEEIECVECTFPEGCLLVVGVKKAQVARGHWF